MGNEFSQSIQQWHFSSPQLTSASSSSLSVFPLPPYPPQPRVWRTLDPCRQFIFDHARFGHLEHVLISLLSNLYRLFSQATSSSSRRFAASLTILFMMRGATLKGDSIIALTALVCRAAQILRRNHSRLLHH
jgi:hypothetical protein